jgi:hypothetical protein
MFPPVKLFRKREIPMPTRAGCLLFGAAGIFLLVAAARSVYPFLAPGSPISNAKLMIIEGWLPDEVLLQALEQRRPGQRIVTTGGPVNFGGSLLEQKTYADVTAERLIQAGADPAVILSAPADDVVSDRTWAAALAVRRVLDDAGLHTEPCNLYTFGAHARRSRMLYRAALGSDRPLGTVVLDSGEYDFRRWWAGSLSFKHVVGEAVSWIYTLCTYPKYKPNPER